MKNKKKNSEKKGKGGFARGVNALLSGKFLMREWVQSNLGFILFIVVIMICYIGYGYFAERNTKKLVQTESRLKEVKAANLEARSRLQKLKQQSQVAESIRGLGLKESTTPPKVIRVSQAEIEDK